MVEYAVLGLVFVTPTIIGAAVACIGTPRFSHSADADTGNPGMSREDMESMVYAAIGAGDMEGLCGTA